MSESEEAVRGLACTAAIVAVGPSVGLPAVIVEVTAEGHSSVSDMASQLADLGLTRMADALPLSRATGWLVLADGGIGRIDVLMRAPNLKVFFGGPCAIAEDWLERVAQAGYCAVIAEMREATGSPSRLAAGLVPVYLTGGDHYGDVGIWPGKVVYRRKRKKTSWEVGQPLGLTIKWDETEAFAGIADGVRAEAREIGYGLVRHRLVVELLLRQKILIPIIVDQVAEDIAVAGPANQVRRGIHARRVVCHTNWLLARTIMAFIARRPIPHWHILGMHVIETSESEEPLEVEVDPWAGELLAIGELDEFEVWLGMKGEGGRSDDVIVYRGDYPVGRLDDHNWIYRGIMLEPRHSNIRIVTSAVRSKATDGSWKLRVGSPSGARADGPRGRNGKRLRPGRE